MHDSHSEVILRRRFGLYPFRICTHVLLPKSETIRLNRTPTDRKLRFANYRSQFHQSLVEYSGHLRIEQLLGSVFVDFVRNRFVYRCIYFKQAGENPFHITIHNGMPLVKRNA